MALDLGVATQINSASKQHVPNPTIAAPRLQWLVMHDRPRQEG